MLRWLLILGIASFVISLLLNIFFVYIPVSRIEKSIDNAIDVVENVANSIDEVGEKVDVVIETIGPEVIKILPKLEEIIEKFCRLDPSLC